MAVIGKIASRGIKYNLTSNYKNVTNYCYCGLHIQSLFARRFEEQPLTIKYIPWLA
jgi:hypothetical protein